MILSRVWYVVLGLAVAVALYVVFIAVGQYERQATRALKEGLASDSQTVEWALKIDARRRLDALLAGSVDGTLQQALIAANSTRDGKIPEAAKAGAKKALVAVSDAIPADWRDDALFAVDRDGQVVAALGFEQVAGNDDFELGGYPAVNDALHGWLRDDVWLLGSKMYVVVARPVEFDATQRPAGAIVGLKEVNERFVSDLAKRTRTALAMYVGGQRVAAGVGVDGFDEEKLDAVGADLSRIDEKTYGDGGRSDVRMVTDDLGVMYARLPGDVWTQGGGFAVVRSKKPLAGPMGFLSNADDRDKANVPWVLLVGVVIFAALFGTAMTVFEHTLPLRELLTQAERLRIGAVDGLQVARFRGSYRLAAQALNQGMERSIEKAGGVTRKPADLESIIGPVPAQPAMSAFSFPLADNGTASTLSAPGAAFIQPPVPVAPPNNRPVPRVGAPLAGFPNAGPTPPPPVVQRPPPPAGPRLAPPPPPARPAQAPPVTAPLPTAPPPAAPPATAPASATKPAFGGANALARGAPPPPLPLPPPSAYPPSTEEDDEATMVGAVPAEVMAQATGGHAVVADDMAQWVSVYEDFIRTKKQCGEPTDGLTYEKFANTLKKNWESLVQKHHCRRVRFSVYVKEGKASLKATPVKD
jgi:hypothetical protein